METSKDLETGQQKSHIDCSISPQKIYDILFKHLTRHVWNSAFVGIYRPGESGSSRRVRQKAQGQGQTRENLPQILNLDEKLTRSHNQILDQAAARIHLPSPRYS